MIIARMYNIFVTLMLFACSDFLWLFITKPIYTKYLSHLLSAHVNWLGVLLFYPLYVMGMYIFVIKAFTEHDSLINLFLYGVFFGMVTYGTYDLTNYATLKEWPGFLVIMDICWGGLITGLISVATVCIVKR